MNARRAALFAITLGMAACGPGINLNGLQPTSITVKTASMTALDATLSSSSLLELQNSNTEISLKAQSTTTYETCLNVAGTTNDALDGMIDLMANSFTPSSTHTFTLVNLGLSKFGSPTGHLAVEIRSDNAGVPGTLLATSTSYDASTIDATSGTLETFTFSTAVAVTSGVKYHLVLAPRASYTPLAFTNFIQWGTINSAASCATLTAVDNNMKTTDNGSTWGATNGGATAPGRFSIQGSTFSAASPTITRTFDAGSEVDWLLSRFTSVENPNGETGAILYDVGVSSDTTPSYAFTQLTKAQVQSHDEFNFGRYLHLRAYFVAGASGGADATLGNVTVGYVP